MGMLLEFILSLHHAKANVEIINNKLFGMTSKYELRVEEPTILLMMEGEYVPMGGEYSSPSKAIEQCIHTFQSVRTDTTI